MLGFSINPHLAMVVATFIFAANYVVGRAVVDHVPAFHMGFVRWGVAAIVILPFAWAHIRNDMALLRTHGPLLALAGVLMPFLGAGVSYYALLSTLALNAGIVQTSLPIFTVLLSWLILGERLRAIQAIGIAAAITGVLAIVFRGEPSKLMDLRFNVGDLILVGCNLALASYSIAIRRLPKSFHPMTVLTGVFAVGALCHAPFVAAEIAGGQFVQPTMTALIGLLFVALLPSIVAIAFWNDGIARLGVNRSGFYMYLVPIFSAALAALFLDERIETYHLVGCILIVIGVTLSTRSRPQPQPGASTAAEGARRP